ncbi:hypothetical protein F8388_008000 [Cannabis sativa]|uniref:Uncharacterized protein n=1 Tax=Cannabis sativa TaxID=3483 RepID=A0A7J6HA88_CANSA|nr:hypothetical protein F8388_008000 [Cannabis sativa]
MYMVGLYHWDTHLDTVELVSWSHCTETLKCKVMLGVDRLDMIKGIPQKILAFEKFLEENPSWRDKVVLLQIVVPTRADVPEFCCLMLFQSYDYH